MPNDENGQFVLNFASYGSIILGDGHDDRVEDRSDGINTITLGNGNRDSVATYGTFDTITLGNGERDSVLAFSTRNVIHLGDGADDSVADHRDGNNAIIFGNGARDIFETTDIVAGDTVTFGNGDGDIVNNYSRMGGNTFTLGDGNGDQVTTDGNRDTFILGNGTGDRVYDFGSVSNVFNTIELGRGAHDYVALTTKFYFPYVRGLAHVTFGGPEAVLDLTHTTGPSFNPPATAGQTYVFAEGLDLISGLVKGDQIILSGGQANTDTLATASNLAGVPKEAVFVTGTYGIPGPGTLSNFFTESATGHDVLLTFDTQGANGSAGVTSVVLVGAASEIAGSTIHQGTITLG